MSAPLAVLTKHVTNFSKLRYIHHVFCRSKSKWIGKRKEQLIYGNVHRTPKKSRLAGEVLTQDSFSSFREMINNCYLQADRSILLQFTAQDNLLELLTRVQHKYGKLEKGFCYSDENGNKLVMIELQNKNSLEGLAEKRVKTPSDLEMVNDCDETLIEKIEEYKPKTLQLDMLNHCDSISDQLMCLHKEIQMSEAMVRLHFFVGMLVTRTIKKIFNDAQAMFFGSSSCGLAVEGKSDLDMVVLMDGVSYPNDLLTPLWKKFRRSTNLFRNIVHIQYARIPIIKFHQIHTNMSCDLSCNTLTGVLMAEMLYWLNTYEPTFYPLVMTVKVWAKEHHLTSQGMGCHFSNYMLTMLLLAYLQHIELLPALKTLYAKTGGVPKQSGTLSAWRDTELKKVKRNVHRILMKIEIGSLLQGFYEYYSKFSFHDHIIDVHFGKVIKRPHKYDICVLNPHEKEHNICKNVRAIQLDRFQTLCKHSAKLLELYQQKTTDGAPWGLACVLSYDTLKQKKRGKLYDLDIDFSDGRVQQIAIEVGRNEEIDVNNIPVNDDKRNDRSTLIGTDRRSNKNPQKRKMNSSSTRIDDTRKYDSIHTENMEVSQMQHSIRESVDENSSGGDKGSRTIVLGRGVDTQFAKDSGTGSISEKKKKNRKKKNLKKT